MAAVLLRPSSALGPFAGVFIDRWRAISRPRPLTSTPASALALDPDPESGFWLQPGPGPVSASAYRPPSQQTQGTLGRGQAFWVAGRQIRSRPDFLAR
jgi:hypothetical protein